MVENLQNQDLRGFKKVIDNTLCPYSDKPFIMGPKWIVEDSYELNIKNQLNDIIDFSNSFTQNEIYGYVLEVAIKTKINTLEQTSELFLNILKILNKLDPAKSNCLDLEKENKKWQFEFNNMRTFFSVFSPCYSPENPRYSYDENIMYIFFQPEESFNMAGVSRLNRQGKINARKKFSDAGRPYDGSLIDKRIEAWLYITPCNIGDKPIKWWK